jgi:hypothetical protein
VSWAKPAAVRFYFDADMFGLANLLSRNESTSPFLATPVGRSRSGSACDQDPSRSGLRVESHRGELGWLIITRDRHIQDGTQNLVGCAHAQYEAESLSPELW